MATMGEPVDPFVDILLNASLNKANGLKILLHNRERVLVDVKGKSYLFILNKADVALTPGKVKRRVADWPRVKNRNVQGHIIISKFAELSPNLVSMDGTNLPPKVAVVGDWGDMNQLVASQIDSSMAFLLETIGVPKGQIARSRKRRAAPKKTQSPRSASAETIPSPVPALGGRFERSLRKGMIVDAYQIEKRLGQGASAEVWCSTVIEPPSGVELKKDDHVAVKFYTIPPHGSQTIRIQREFDLGATAGHKHLARVFDLVISPSRPFHTFMVMEYVDGPTLKGHISSVGKLSALHTALIGIQLFEGLAELHSLEALHRDVKAANIMLSQSDGDDIEIKLVDLGIISVANDTRLTAHSSFLGSKHSAPMEQLTGKELDTRTDIYGAGSVLFHCFQGKPMYDGAGPEAAIVVEMINAPEQLKPTPNMSPAEEALITFINSCIAVKKEDRPASCDECLDALRKIHSNLASRVASVSIKSSRPKPVTSGSALFSLHFHIPVTEEILTETKRMCDRWVTANSFQLIGFSRSPAAGDVIDIEVEHNTPLAPSDIPARILVLRDILSDLPLDRITIDGTRTKTS